MTFLRLVLLLALILTGPAFVVMVFGSSAAPRPRPAGLPSARAPGVVVFYLYIYIYIYMFFVIYIYVLCLSFLFFPEGTGDPNKWRAFVLVCLGSQQRCPSEKTHSFGWVVFRVARKPFWGLWRSRSKATIFGDQSGILTRSHVLNICCFSPVSFGGTQSLLEILCECVFCQGAKKQTEGTGGVEGSFGSPQGAKGRLGLKNGRVLFFEPSTCHGALGVWSRVPSRFGAVPKYPLARASHPNLHRNDQRAVTVVNIYHHVTHLEGVCVCVCVSNYAIYGVFKLGCHTWRAT